MTITPLHLFNVKIAFTELIEALKGEGYTVRETNKPDEIISDHYVNKFLRCTATNEDRGVKISVETTTNTDSGLLQHKEIKIGVNIRNNRGRYNVRSGYYFGMNQRSVKVSSDIDKWVVDVIKDLGKLRGEKVDNPPITSKNALKDFPPLRFEKPGHVYGPIHEINKNKNHWLVHCLFRSCYVVGVVTILKNLKISELGVSEPGAEPWFHVKGECFRKDSFVHPELIVREDEGHLVYYPIRRGKVTNEFKQKKELNDFNNVTVADGAIINLAIKTFTENL